MNLLDNKNLRSGIIVTSLFSILAAPLAYVRNWLLSLFGSDVVANFAIILLITNLVNTFFIFGASTVFSTFIPKLKSKKKQSKFIISSIGLSLILTVVGLLLTSLFPNLIFKVLPNSFDLHQYFMYLAIFVIIYGLSISFNFALVGLKKYRLSAFFNSNQTFIIVIALSFIYVFNREYLMNESFQTFVIILCAVWSINLIFSIRAIKKEIGITFQWYLPEGFWNQAIYAHLGTILSFAYVYIDQLLVLGYIGKLELAAYFLITQIARLVNFLTLKLTQVFHTSFAVQLSGKSKASSVDLIHLYKEVAKYTIFISFSISMVLVVFGSELLSIFDKQISLKQ